MPAEIDSQFYDRADAHIQLSNDQISAEAGRGKVSASMLYATARFNAWLIAARFDSAQAVQDARQQSIEYFVHQYQKMLEEHFDDYARKFAKYMETMPSDPGT